MPRYAFLRQQPEALIGGPDMTPADRPARSVLYIPGSREASLDKAPILPADAIIFDLEDAVAPD
jgi:hypothetical protein